MRPLTFLVGTRGNLSYYRRTSFILRGCSCVILLAAVCCAAPAAAAAAAAAPSGGVCAVYIRGKS